MEWKPEKKPIKVELFNKLKHFIDLGLAKVNDKKAEDLNDSHFSMPKALTDYRSYLDYKLDDEGRVISFGLSIPVKSKTERALLELDKHFGDFIHFDDGVGRSYFTLSRDKTYYNSIVCGWHYPDVDKINEELLKLIQHSEGKIRNYSYDDDFNWVGEIKRGF